MQRGQRKEKLYGARIKGGRLSPTYSSEPAVLVLDGTEKPRRKERKKEESDVTIAKRVEDSKQEQRESRPAVN